MKKLLIVEDEKMIRQGIKSIAMRAPVPIEEILECKNGEEAYEVVKNEVIDVMITDIRMPGKDGITLVKEIQVLPHIPKIVVISGYDDFNYAVELLRCGAKDYLLKPIEREKIFDVLIKLEKELCEEKEEAEKRNLVWQQQLRYCMLGEASLDSCKVTFEEFLQNEKYLLCCTNIWREDWLEETNILGLTKMQHQNIYIMRVSQKQLVQKVFCEDYVGFSEEHAQFEELKIAFKEALCARKQSFYQESHQIDYKDCSNNLIKIKEKEKQREENETNSSRDSVIELTQNEIDQYVQLFGTSKWEQNDKFIKNLYYNVKCGKIAPEDFEHTMQCFVKGIEDNYQSVIDFSDTRVLHHKSIYEYDSGSKYLENLMEWLVELHERILSEFSDFKNKQKIQTALIYIKENYNKDLNMAVVSNYISMNYSLFSFTFKQYTGTYFVQYLKDLRIAKAKELLEKTEKKIVEISNEVGYENEKHFMKIFKNHCGVSPSEFRKNSYVGKAKPVH
ncbi:response regulator transcription factor [Lachnoclostridium phytofermentans]|uniref:Stage 0 sporulation protein A homolog n=1 Tax=Lachnoclostridium phytofermentans (strain ATCC 700394 / DSM 18823 / ISDg) TaxID=357809 RepID=A9KLC1_LACP7|nr:response regulator [Lachnoclostridium phytofermentans]ABX41250.1 two component transcriptional regulator, AraC family [Lachnoclostridium phytofermentans ISDg]